MTVRQTCTCFVLLKHQNRTICCSVCFCFMVKKRNMFPFPSVEIYCKNPVASHSFCCGLLEWTSISAAVKASFSLTPGCCRRKHMQYTQDKFTFRKKCIFLCQSGGSLREAPNASRNQSFHWRMMILSLSQQRPPAVACGSTPVTSALLYQPPPPSTLLAGSSTWCTTILQRHGEKSDF